MSIHSCTARVVLRGLVVPLVAGLGALGLAATASAHARVSPPVSITNELQLYSLAVPTEKSNLTTSKIVMTVPTGFAVSVPRAAGVQQGLHLPGATNLFGRLDR